LTSLKHLHCLLAISGQLGITRAAESCVDTQSTPSAGSKELEDGRLELALIALTYETACMLVEPFFYDDLWIVGRKNDADYSHSMVAGGLLDMS
jgi:DNA-binding transcriptional LysR family regulator